MPYGVGVDLGTTRTTAAWHADGGVEVARLGRRRPEIPSLVFAEPGGGLLIGEAAERRGRAEPARLAREFKRRIGDPAPILLGGAPFPAHALTARLLRHVLDTVTGLRGAPPSAVTLTCPANWGPYKRELFDQAVTLADAGPVTVMSEPEAAARQHATARAIGPGETVAVYDLGGGTFDAAVLRRDGDGFVLLGRPEGIEQLGGADFDEAVLGHVLGVLGDAAGVLDPADPAAVAALARLRGECVAAKEALSFDTEVLIPVALPGLHTRVRLERSDLEAMITPLLRDTIAAMQRALRAAGTTPDGVSALLLAGGSSRIPLVERLLAAEFGRPVVADPHPEHSIALGAAAATPETGRVVGSGRAVPPPSPAVAGRAVPPSPPAVAAAAAVPASSAGPTVPPSSPAVPPSSLADPPPSSAGPPSSPAGLPSSPGGLSAAPDGSPRRRRSVPLLAGAGVLAVVLLGAAAVAALTRDDDGADPVGAAAEPAPPFPTDPMLIRVDTGADNEPERRTNVFVLTPGRAERRQITASDGDVLPKWSHDRTRIAMTRNAGGVNTAYVLNADGSGLTKVADGVTGGRMTWSMDDRRLAFVRQVDGVNQIFTVAPDGSAPVQLTRSRDEKDDPTWLADGRHITYWVKRDGARQIFALDVTDPQEPGRLIAGPDAGPVNDPAPSPDGKFVLYTRETGPGTSDIWMIGIDGSNPHRVIGHPERDMDPAWAPDGTWFAFVRGELHRPTIVVARTDGTGETTLTTGNAREGHPSWY